MEQKIYRFLGVNQYRKFVIKVKKLYDYLFEKSVYKKCKNTFIRRFRWFTCYAGCRLLMGANNCISYFSA